MKTENIIAQIPRMVAAISAACIVYTAVPYPYTTETHLKALGAAALAFINWKPRKTETNP